MNETNKSLRVRTNVGEDKYISVNLTSEYDILEILSLKINQRGAYRYHTNTYGVVVGRVLANNGFGVPNAKLSLFIERDVNDDTVLSKLYPYVTVGTKNADGIRYNLLPSNQKDDCHQVVGTFPSKRMMLDDNSVIEVFDKYYTYTTRTNESGDYMFFGIPVGTYNLHMDLDLSDCGKLSQRPRDFIDNGYTYEQFENPNQFKIDTELGALPQIHKQDTVVEVKPFWGDENEGTEVGITREDISINYTFKPECVFIGSIISDTPNDGINKKCIPTNKMGDMRELVTGSGTIEIIRKTVSNTIEELQIKGKQLINGNGVWCFKIPMNLDYITTDEYGNTVPTDNPDKGIPTRCEVRFRISMDETDSETLMYKRGKVLVPNNPESEEKTDYEFGSDTKDESFRSLMWNGVYSVKSFIPRFQKSSNILTNKFTGIKNVNIHGGNSPMPYNNIRIKIPFMFWLMCNVIKLFIRIVKIINDLKVGLMNLGLGLINLPYAYISNEVCPDLEYWYFAPGMNTTAPSNTVVRKFWKWLTGKDNRCKKWEHESTCLTFKEIAKTLKDNGEYGDGDSEITVLYQYVGPGNTKLPHIVSEDEIVSIVGDGNVNKIVSIDNTNNFSVKDHGNDTENYKDYRNWVRTGGMSAPSDKMSTEVRNAITKNDPRIHLTPDIDYLMQCVEMNLAQEYEVIKFDFYNDWINGVIYLPRWARSVKFKRKRRNGKKEVTQIIKGCIDDKQKNKESRKYVQQCSLKYNKQLRLTGDVGCDSVGGKLKCHKKQGMDYISVLGPHGGAVHEHLTMLKDSVYYMKPFDKSAPMFATDIIMLGSLFDCNEYGIPSTFSSLVNTTYKLPTNLAMTNVDEDSYSYLDSMEYEDEDEDGPPKLSFILDNNKFKCGKDCSLQYLAGSGVTATIPSYDQLKQIMVSRGEISDKENIVIEYDDVFPVTEMAGIEWGYRGPEYENAEINNSSNKLFSPGGHFMGLSCGNAETNIKSCVNLKRACEIGTTLSERFEIPVGFKDNPQGFDEVNYLYVAPNGVISKDQVVDVTFRSAFATMNQNSLKTFTDPVTNHKKYDFSYLIPDSFDGSIEHSISSITDYNRRIPLKWDSYWNDAKDLPSDMKEIYDNDIAYEQGYTITRVLNVKNNDYITFRHGTSVLNDSNFLKRNNSGNSMPIYKNSFYFYFGLKEGFTALDEFRKQYFASCGRTTIVGEQSYIEYEYKMVNTGFTYDVIIDVYNVSLPLSYTYMMSGEDETKTTVTNWNDDNIIIANLPIGIYDIMITDADGNNIVKTIEIDDFTIEYDVQSVVDYYIQEKRNEITDFNKNGTNGGYISGTFNLTQKSVDKPLNLNYKVGIRKYNNNVSVGEIIVGDENWGKLYDSDKHILWLFGAGEYRLFIYEYSGNVQTGEYFYGSFNVMDGEPLPVIKIGSYDYFNEDGSSDFEDFTLDMAKSDEWTDYEKYRTIVNLEKVGGNNEFFLNFHISGNENYENIYAARPEIVDSNEVISQFFMNNEELTSLNLKLDFSTLRFPSDYPTRGNVTLRGDFYYTAFDGNVFATQFMFFDVVNGVANIILPEMGIYCIVDGDNKTLYTAFDENRLTYNKKCEADKVIVGKMISTPVYFNPFAFRCVVTYPNNVINPNFKQFKVQSYKGVVYLDNDEDDDKVITFTDCKGENSRKRKSFQLPEFGDLWMTYSHIDGLLKDKCTIQISGLNESLRGVSYDLCRRQNALAFNEKGDFIKDINEMTYLQSTTTKENFLIGGIGGELTGTISIPIDELANEKFWLFGRQIMMEGLIHDTYYLNDYCECTIIKPSKNVLEFKSEPWHVFENWKMVHQYNEGQLGYYLYKKTEEGDFVRIEPDSELNIFSSLQFKMEDTNAVRCLTLKTSDENVFRSEEIYKSMNVFNTGGIPGEYQFYNYSITDEDEPFKTYFTKNEDTTVKNYEVSLECSGMIMDSALKEGIEDGGDNFTMVLVVKDHSGNIVFEDKLKDNFTFEVTLSELLSISHFELLYVYDYKDKEEETV